MTELPTYLRFDSLHFFDLFPPIRRRKINMSSKQEDENYWNRSDFKPFSFDDEEVSGRNKLFGNPISTSLLTDIIFDGVNAVQKPETQKKPLELLVSKQSLSKIFGEGSSSPTNLHPQEELNILKRQIQNQWVPARPSRTVRLILTGQQYSLHLYRSLSLKKDLLDEAIKSGDGNAILSVVLFLSATLKRSLFYKILQSRPVAVSHYVQFLATRIMISELIDLLEMLGNRREAAIKQFSVVVQGIQNKETKLQRLNTCYSNHFSQPDSKDKQFLQDYIKYLQWILSLDFTDKTILGNSIISSLSYLCKNYWNEPKSSKYSPWFLSLQQNMLDRQLQWTLLTSRASIQSWEDIETQFLTKGWIGGKKLKTILPAEKILVELSRYNAPYNILSQFFEVIGSLEKRLELARQLLCHRAAIDAFVLMKDRQGLLEYKLNLKPQSEDYLFAENALRSQIKWKN